MNVDRFVNPAQWQKQLFLASNSHRTDAPSETGQIIFETQGTWFSDAKIHGRCSMNLEPWGMSYAYTLASPRVAVFFSSKPFFAIIAHALAVTLVLFWMSMTTFIISPA